MTKQEKIEQIVTSVMENHAAYAVKMHKKFDRLFALYKNELRDESITAETEAKVRLGQGFALVENFVSKIMANQPRFRYAARESSDVNPAEAYNSFNEYQHDEADSMTQYEQIARFGGIFGLAGYKKGWKVEKTIRSSTGREILGVRVSNPTIIRLAEKFKFGKKVKIEKEETISNWTIRALSPYDLIWDVGVDILEDSSVIGHKTVKKYGELENEGYDMSKVADEAMKNEQYWGVISEGKKNWTKNKVLETVPVMVAELYVKYYNADGIIESYVVTMCGLTDSTLNMKPQCIRFDKNPFDKQFCPIWFFRPVTVPLQVEGVGMLEMAEGIMNAEEDTFNINLEAAWLDVARPMEYNAENVLAIDGVQYKPRTLIPVRELGKTTAVLPTPVPNAGVASYLLTFLERAKQNVSAVTDYQTGANQLTRNQTATEVNTKTFFSEQRLNKILRSFEKSVLEKSGKMALWLNQQYLSDTPEVVYRILGKKGGILENQIKFKDIEAVKDIVVVPGSTAYAMRTENINKWMALLNVANAEMQLPNGVPVNREYIWERLVEDGYDIKDSENFIPSLREREEASVAKKMRSLQDAKAENLHPSVARVLPDDVHSIHIALHKAAIQNQGVTNERGEFIPYSTEDMVLAVSHYDAHVAALGGFMPKMALALENALGQRINNQINPQMNGQNTRVPGQQPGGAAASFGSF